MKCKIIWVVLSSPFRVKQCASEHVGIFHISDENEIKFAENDLRSGIVGMIGGKKC